MIGMKNLVLPLTSLFGSKQPHSLPTTSSLFYVFFVCLSVWWSVGAINHDKLHAEDYGITVELPTLVDVGGFFRLCFERRLDCISDPREDLRFLTSSQH